MLDVADDDEPSAALYRKAGLRPTGTEVPYRQCQAVGFQVPDGIAVKEVDSQLLAAWSELHEATPPGWYVGKPADEPRRAVPCSMYAFDATEPAEGWSPRASARQRR